MSAGIASSDFHGSRIGNSGNLFLRAAAVGLLTLIPMALGAQEAVSIGPEGGFQRLRDAEVDHSGRVFALDGGMAAITVFHPDGRPLTTLRGDPERDIRFEDPVAMAIDSKGLLHVVEAGARRLLVFDTRSAPYPLVSLRDLHFQPADICLIGDRRFVLLGLDHTSSEPIIRELDGSGRQIAQFGSREKPSSSEAAVFGELDEFHNYGIMHCDPRREEIYVVTSYFPLVRVFDLGGREVRRFTLQDFQPQGFRLRDGRCCVFYIPHPDPMSGHLHVSGAVTMDPDGNLVVTVEEHRFRNRERTIVFQRRVIDPETGVERTRRPAPGRVFGWTRDRVSTYTSEAGGSIEVQEQPGR
jgi:hypothetical protein